jgi:proton-coupled amino acid transporter
MVANVLLFSGLIGTFALMCLGDFAYETEDLHYIAPASGWPMFLGTVVFSLEAIGIVIPLENKMQNPKDFVSLFGIVNVGLMVTMSMYTLIGFMGYFKYGENVQAAVIMNLTARNL